MDWQDVEAKLQGRVDEVCARLLPNGRREGMEWVCGNLDGQPGRSLKVNLGGKLGYWRDFAGDKGGKTLMSLWCTVRGQAFKVCIREAKEFLGLRDDFEKRIAQYPNPKAESREQKSEGEESAWRGVVEVWAKCQPLTRGGPVWKYLVEQRRIEEFVLEWYGVRELVSQNRWVMVFPYFWQETEAAERLLEASVVPAWLKFECLDRPGGKKKEWTSRAPEKCLWGTQVAGSVAEFKEAKDVLICEGEKDALSWASYGCSAWGVLPVSVPFGAKWKGQDKGRPSPNREWLDRCWEWLQGFESVYVAMDSDEAGHKAAADIISEIGPRRCRLVQLPLKADDGRQRTEAKLRLES